MKLSTVDAVTDFEQCLSDALKNAQRDRLKIEARLATSLTAEECIEREHESHADNLAEEVAELARKFADEAAKVATTPNGRGEGMADDEHVARLLPALPAPHCRRAQCVHASRQTGGRDTPLARGPRVGAPLWLLKQVRRCEGRTAFE